MFFMKYQDYQKGIRKSGLTGSELEDKLDQIT